MNSSASDSSLVVQELGEYLEHYNVINMYTTLFIIMFGFVGNLLALIILAYSRHKLPRIIGNNYLIMLTICNTLYLLIQFYVGTYNRMIYHFNMDYTATLQFLDTNIVFCKSMPYLKYVTRLMNTMLTVCFSIERLIAVYCPLQMRSLNEKCKCLFKISIIISFTVPIYLLFLTELVPNRETQNIAYQKLGIRNSFNFNSLTPLFGDSTCSVSKKNLPIMLIFHFFLFLIIFLCYVVVAVSILAIVMRVKKSKSFIFAFRSKNPSNSGRMTEAPSTNNNRSSSKELLDTKIIQEKIQPMEIQVDDRKTSHSSFTSVEVSKKKSNQIWISHRIQNTKMLTSISISYVLLNLPYFVVMLVSMMVGARSEESSNSNIEALRVRDVAFRLKVWSCVLITEIFQLANFSLVGLLFFCSGKIFRLNAFKLCKKLYCFGK